MLGFNLKSQLGAASTLLKAGKTTNFIYDIQNVSLSASQIETINQIDSSSNIKDRISEIERLGGQLQYKTMEREIFKNNLTLIDSLLPNILADYLQIYFSTGLSSIKQITRKLEDENPLQFDTTNKHKYYEYKIKRFLVDVALGLMPSKVWDGKYDATGGYLIVKEDGEIVCYHIYNKNDFENYLFNNTKFETASTTRHGFGLVEEIDGKQLFKLNLQIRFIK
ncbi:MAG: HpaII family restriction endonuclease [Bacteroidales bacterium]|nr:HpaII family restriction endonuclease [Bacteroidales bacterium]